MPVSRCDTASCTVFARSTSSPSGTDPACGSPTTNTADGSYTCASMDEKTLVRSPFPGARTMAATVGDALRARSSEGSGDDMRPSLWSGSPTMAISAAASATARARRP